MARASPPTEARFRCDMYEELHCTRGDAENHVAEQYELFADRASSATMQANPVRMRFSAMAYGLVDTLRRVGLRFTESVDASARTIRLYLLQLRTQVRAGVRRIHFAIASRCPSKVEFKPANFYLEYAISSACTTSRTENAGLCYPAC
jgi:hypothetical protein